MPTNFNWPSHKYDQISKFLLICISLIEIHPRIIFCLFEFWKVKYFGLTRQLASFFIILFSILESLKFLSYQIWYAIYQHDMWNYRDDIKVVLCWQFLLFKCAAFYFLKEFLFYYFQCSLLEGNLSYLIYIVHYLRFLPVLFDT